MWSQVSSANRQQNYATQSYEFLFYSNLWIIFRFWNFCDAIHVYFQSAVERPTNISWNSNLWRSMAAFGLWISDLWILYFQLTTNDVELSSLQLQFFFFANAYRMKSTERYHPIHESMLHIYMSYETRRHTWHKICLTSAINFHTNFFFTSHKRRACSRRLHSTGGRTHHYYYYYWREKITTYIIIWS